MSDQFVAEIRMFPFNFAPTGWAQCMGQLMPISQNTALFSLLGTMYGGDGKSTFALPDLQDNVPIGMNWGGPGLSERYEGEIGGAPYVTLLESEVPAHTHAVSASDEPGTATSPENAVWGRPTAVRGQRAYDAAPSQQVAMNPMGVSVTGGSLPHENRQPYLGLNYCIALQGIFPQRP